MTATFGIDSGRIGAALAMSAVSAVAASGLEIGANDFRISDIGPDGDTGYVVNQTAVAYNSVDDEYLVVWRAEGEPPLVNQEFEIFGQRIDAATGTEVGDNDFRISFQGPNGSTQFRVNMPAVAYNSTNNEYLVVWRGTFMDLAIDEYEIFGQRIDGATGAAIGASLRISDMGPDADWQYRPDNPEVTYNSVENEYLVVWTGDDDTAPLVNNEQEVFGQRIDGATGTEVGVNDFRISDMGPDGSTTYRAGSPAVTCNPVTNEYLVVWSGDDDAGGTVAGEYEIFGQRLDGATGAEIGANDFRISEMGPDGDTLYEAAWPVVAHNDLDNEYLVAWQGTAEASGVEESEYEIFGQRLDAATGADAGGGDFPISGMGPPGDTSFFVERPAVTYNGPANEYLVAWIGQVADGETALDTEVFGQRIDGATGNERGADDFRISDMGPDGDPGFNAWEPAVTYTGAGHEYLVVWYGDDDTGGLVDNENELFGQRLGCPGDPNGDYIVDIDDLTAVILAWGACPAGSCPADLDGDGEVGVDDLTAVIVGWGPCM